MLRLGVSNNTGKLLRMWQQDNSWGWKMPRILLRDEAGTVPLQLRPALRVWTRNFPSFVELQPGESTSYYLGAADFMPDDLADAQRYQDCDVLLSAELISPAGPEQQDNDIWSGALSSKPQLFAGPQRWLNSPVTEIDKEKS